MPDPTLPLIALDGPAAVGKSSTAKAVAQVLGWSYLDTGAMYRATALALLRAKVPLEDPSGLDDVLATLAIRLVGSQTYLGEEDVTSYLRTPELAHQVSAVAANARVREVLVTQQRSLAGAGGWIVDGRDIGTTVFPDACCKIFLTASLAARTQRRWRQLQAKGDPQTLEAVGAELQRRDLGVTTRAVAPLRKAADAVTLDSSAIAQDQVVAWIVAHHRSHVASVGRSE